MSQIQKLTRAVSIFLALGTLVGSSIAGADDETPPSTAFRGLNCEAPTSNAMAMACLMSNQNREREKYFSVSKCVENQFTFQTSANEAIEDASSKLLQTQADLQQKLFENQTQTTAALQREKINFENAKAEFEDQMRELRKTKRDAKKQLRDGQIAIRQQCNERAVAVLEQSRALGAPGTVVTNFANLASHANDIEASYGREFERCMNDRFTREQWGTLTQDYLQAMADFDDAEEGFRQDVNRARRLTIQNQNLILQSKQQTEAFSQAQFASQRSIAVDSIKRTKRILEKQTLLGGLKCFENREETELYNKSIRPRGTVE